MATRKPKSAVPKDEQLDSQKLDLFDALNAIDKKDYGYYSRLTEEQQKKFSPYIMIIWLTVVKGRPENQQYHVLSTEHAANKHFFNEHIQKHPDLQWKMLCAASPGLGKQFRQWIPTITPKVIHLETPAKVKDMKEYYQKLYAGASSDDILAISEAYVETQNRMCYFAEEFPNMKRADIEVLSGITSDQEIAQYEKDQGNG